MVSSPEYNYSPPPNRHRNCEVCLGGFNALRLVDAGGMLTAASGFCNVARLTAILATVFLFIRYPTLTIDVSALACLAGHATSPFYFSFWNEPGSPGRVGFPPGTRQVCRPYLE